MTTPDPFDNHGRPRAPIACAFGAVDRAADRPHRIPVGPRDAHGHPADAVVTSSTPTTAPTETRARAAAGSGDDSDSSSDGEGVVHRWLLRWNRYPVKVRLKILALVVAIITCVATCLQAVAAASDGEPELVVTAVLLLDTDAHGRGGMRITDPGAQTVTASLVRQRGSVAAEFKIENQGRTPLTVDAVEFPDGPDTGRYDESRDPAARRASCVSIGREFGRCWAVLPVRVDPGASLNVIVPLSPIYDALRAEPSTSTGVRIQVETGGLPDDVVNVPTSIVISG